jgi:hypothetical protein
MPAPLAPTNLKALVYPTKNLLLYWDLEVGVDYYNMYWRAEPDLLFTKINTVLIPPRKCPFELMPVDTLPPNKVSWDPFLYVPMFLASVSTVRASQFVVTAVSGVDESDYSNIYTFYPHGMYQSSKQEVPNQMVQLQVWDAASQRWINWGGSGGSGGGGDVNIIQQDLAALKISKDANANTISNPIYVNDVSSGGSVTLKPILRFKEDFVNNTIDIISRWNKAIGGNGSSAIANSNIVLSVTTTSGDYVEYLSRVKFASYDATSAIAFRMWANFGSAAHDNNQRSFGAYSPTKANGAIFRVIGTTLYVVVIKSSVETQVATAVVLDSNWHKYEIKITAQKEVVFLIDDVIISTQTSSSSLLIDENTFSVYFRNLNNGITSVTPTLSILGVGVTDESGAGRVIGGMDKDNIQRDNATDQYGRLITIDSNIESQINNWSFSSEVATPLQAGLWKKVLTFAVPQNYAFSAIKFSGFAGKTDCFARLVKQSDLGTYNIGTDTFVQGSVFSSDQKFASSVEAEVTTIISTDVTLTMTYTNQDKVAGRTATCVLATSDPVGLKKQFTLQGDDFGVTAITAVARSGAATGIVKLYGIDELAFLYNEVLWSMDTKPFVPGQVFVPYGIDGTINIEITSNSLSPTKRKINLLGSFIQLKKV